MVADIVPSELLRSFLIVQRTGSFTDAAEILGLTQPAISLQMKRLQQIVGGELFERGAGGLHLTAKGETVEQYAVRIVNLNVQMLRRCGSGNAGRTFRVGVPNIFASTHLLSLKNAVESGLPEHRFLITWGRSDELIDNVRTGYLDAAFAFLAPSDPALAGVIVDQTWQESMSWACSKGFVVSEVRPIPFLSWPESVSDRLATKALADANASYEVAVVASDLTTHLAAARAGLGVFVMPRRILPPDMKVADFHYLPRLPGTTSGVCTNEAVPKAEASILLRAIANAMAPNVVLSSAQAS